MLLREQVTCTLIWGEESLHFLPYKSYNNPWIIDIKFKVSSMMACLLVCRHWGQMASQKRMNFRKSSKQPLIPPPYFRKIILHFFRISCSKSLFKGPKSALGIFGLKMALHHFGSFSKKSSVLVTPSVP